jgi:hypothetical protein
MDCHDDDDAVRNGFVSIFDESCAWYKACWANMRAMDPNRCLHAEYPPYTTSNEDTSNDKLARKSPGDQSMGIFGQCCGENPTRTHCLDTGNPGTRLYSLIGMILALKHH